MLDRNFAEATSIDDGIDPQVNAQRKSFEEMCREDFGIEFGQQYILEVLKDIEFSHWSCGKKEDAEAKFEFTLRKGTKLEWLPNSNKRIVKLRFEGDVEGANDRTGNDKRFEFIRSVRSPDMLSEYTVRSSSKRFGSSTLKREGIIHIPATFFWNMFFLERNDRKVAIYDKSGNIMKNVRDATSDIIEGKK